jgi:hypothetical protein
MLLFEAEHRQLKQYTDGWIESFKQKSAEEKKAAFDEY